MASTPSSTAAVAEEAAVGAASKPTPTPRQRANPSPTNVVGETDQRPANLPDSEPRQQQRLPQQPPQQPQQQQQQQRPAAKTRTLRLRDHVGFDSLPDQIVSKAISQGFAFNILCIGETG